MQTPSSLLRFLAWDSPFVPSPSSLGPPLQRPDSPTLRRATA
jgi:hypothetical protein